MRKAIVAVVVLLVLVTGFVLYQSNKSSKKSTPAPSPAAMKQTPTAKPSQAASPSAAMSAAENGSGAAKQAAVKEFTVTGQNFSFTPNTLTVNKGDKVKITFKNAEGFHDFVLPDFSVSMNKIGTGAEETAEFTADKTGTFEFYCSVGNHRQMGMKGTLTVK